jgi:hypothetical protein
MRIEGELVLALMDLVLESSRKVEVLLTWLDLYEMVLDFILLNAID